MAIQVTTKGNRVAVDTINVLIYGQPSTGKTSLCYTMDSPLVLDFDGGAHRSQQSTLGTTIHVDTWADMPEVMNDYVTDPQYKTIVIDTVGSALDYMAAYIIATNPKMGTAKGTLTMQGWGELKAIFSSWFKRLNIMGKNVVMIAHHKEEREGDNVRKRPDVQGSSYGLVMKQADFVGFAYLSDTSKRVIGFAPTGDYFGKDSAALGVVTVDDFNENPLFGVHLIDRMIKAVGNSNNEHEKVLELLRDYRERLKACTEPAQLDALVNDLASAPDSVKTQMRALVVKHAKSAGWSYDKSSSTYTVQA